MIINKLLTDSFIHTSKRIVVTSKIIGELAKGAAHQLLNINTLLLGDSGGKTESVNATSNTDTGGVNWSGGINVFSDFDDIQVRGVRGTRTDSINSPPHVLQSSLFVGKDSTAGRAAENT